MAEALDIRHDAERRRLSTRVDDHIGYVTYELDGKTMALTHTVVPAAIGGRGIAGALVKATLDHAREQGWKVDPACSYADAWMQRHPDYADLRA